MSNSSDSDDCNSYNGEEEFAQMVTEMANEFASSQRRVRRVGGYYRCTFCPGRMQRNWSRLELLNHATGLSTRGNGLKGPQHKALADYILYSSELPASARSVALVTAVATSPCRQRMLRTPSVRSA